MKDTVNGTQVGRERSLLFDQPYYPPNAFLNAYRQFCVFLKSCPLNLLVTSDSFIEHAKFLQIDRCTLGLLPWV